MRCGVVFSPPPATRPKRGTFIREIRGKWGREKGCGVAKTLTKVHYSCQHAFLEAGPEPSKKLSKQN